MTHIAAAASLPGVAPTVERRIADIEVLRAAAILMVLVEHMSFNLIYWDSALLDFNHRWWRGAAGVDLFFTISGFVIARSLLPRLRACVNGTAFLAEALTFLVRRFWRLQPAAWTWLALPIVPTILFNRSGAFHTIQTNLASALAAITAVNNIRNGAIGEHEGWSMGLYFPYWSLSLEEQFYLLLPILAWLFRARLAFVMLAMVAYQFVMPFWLPLIATRPGEIAMGVLLALCSDHPAYGFAEPVFLARNKLLRVIFLPGLIAILGLALSTLLYPLRHMAFGFAAIITGALVYAAGFNRNYLIHPGALQRVLIWIGARSYSLYLIHIPAYALARETVFRFHPPGFVHDWTEALPLAAMGLSLTFVLAELSYRFVERPARRYGRSVTVPARQPA